MNYTLTFTEQQMHVIDAALKELPFRIAAPLIQSINEQIQKARDLQSFHDEHEQAEISEAAGNN